MGSIEQPRISIHDEVSYAQKEVWTRLTGAITELDLPAGTPVSSLPSIPLIDLSPSFSANLDDRRAVALQIREACTTSGFFQICNHGISQSVTDGILAQARRFFTIPLADREKIHIRHSSIFRGYESGNDTNVTGDARVTESETKEAFNFGYEPALDLDSTYTPGYVELDGRPPGPGRCNVWPDLPGFQHGVAEYYTRALALCRHLLRLFALGLDLDESYFDAATGHPGGIGRLIRYPAQPVGEMDSKYRTGLGAHTDYEVLTLLLASNHPGLEILFPPSELTDHRPLWRRCPIRPGALTVNVADFLQRWTNGLYRSTVHRVISRPGEQERYSVPLFFSIDYEREVEPLPEHAVGKSMFQPLSAGQYVLERLKATV